MPKKSPSQQTAKAAVTSSSPSTSALIDLKSQQGLLDIYAASFSDVLSSENLSETLQEIKQALFNRDFAAAFGKTEYLKAYAARWSPTRSLGYAAIFKNLRSHINGLAQAKDAELDESQAEGSDGALFHLKELRMLCIGGCAAEHVAFASHLKSSSLRGTLTLLDSAPWPTISNKIQHDLTHPPSLSPYASASVKEANNAFISSSQLSLNIEQQDVLSLSKDTLETLVGPSPIIVTLLFTLNELYTGGGIGKTTKFLGNLGGALAPGSLLLVVDSPGSYSEAAVGKEKKRYPMHWLLDHTLLEKSPATVEWEKLESQDSVWHRLSEDLTYPIPLENMRYQLHLYLLDKTTNSAD